jgi:hypothetical protein
LKKATIEDKQWFDSAMVKKNEAFELLVKTNDWERTLILIEKECEDNSFKKEMRKIILNYAKEQIENNKMDSLMQVVSEYEKDLSMYLDSTLIIKITNVIADKTFTGIWVAAKSSLKGHEIYFEKNDDLYFGKSNKSGSGWNKDKTIYKVSDYKSKMTWKCQTRIFSTNYYYDTTKEYFGTKGSIKVLSIDSFLIDYATTNERYVTFVRKQDTGTDNP